MLGMGITLCVVLFYLTIELFQDGDERLPAPANLRCKKPHKASLG